MMNNEVDFSRRNGTVYCRWNRNSSRHPWNLTIDIYSMPNMLCRQILLLLAVNRWWCELRPCISWARPPKQFASINFTIGMCMRMRTMNDGHQFLTWTKAIAAVGHQITHSINEKMNISIQQPYHIMYTRKHFDRDAFSPSRLAKWMQIFGESVTGLYWLLQNGWSDGVACAQCSYFGKLFSMPSAVAQNSDDDGDDDDSLESKLWFRSGNTMAVLFVVPSGGNVGDKRR